MLKIDNYHQNHKAKEFVEAFFADNNLPKFIVGRNKYAESIANMVAVDGFIDDFTQENEYLGKPILSMNNVSRDALVVLSQIGKPFGTEKRVRQFQFETLDYFSFFRYAPKKPKNIEFWEGFEQDFIDNRNQYEKIYTLLADTISKNQYYNLINFRLSYDLYYMRGFSSIEDKQYFEDFIPYTDNEVFVDVGSFDGYTSQAFARICPDYKAIHVFEPEAQNMKIVRQKLDGYNNVIFHQKGLSNKKQTLKFDFAGSASKISATGNTTIEVDKLADIILSDKITFIKMDIEGAEQEALEGASELIKNYHPKLAISVYHKAQDFWKIPELVFSIRPDYKLFLRHYTEGISETVMFFIP